jgi:hypothetical protein
MECPQAGCGGVFRQINSNWFPTCSVRIGLCISCMNEVKKCSGKGFGWICALNRWSVQERAQTSVCPIGRQVLHYLAWELYRQIAAYILSRLTPFLLVWGVRKGVGGGGSFWAGGPEFTQYVRFFFLRLLLAQLHANHLVFSGNFIPNCDTHVLNPLHCFCCYIKKRGSWALVEICNDGRVACSIIKQAERNHKEGSSKRGGGRLGLDGCRTKVSKVQSCARLWIKGWKCKHLQSKLTPLLHTNTNTHITHKYAQTCNLENLSFMQELASSSNNWSLLLLRVIAGHPTGDTLRSVPFSFLPQQKTITFPKHSKHVNKQS